MLLALDPQVKFVTPRSTSLEGELAMPTGYKQFRGSSGKKGDWCVCACAVRQRAPGMLRAGACGRG